MSNGFDHVLLIGFGGPRSREEVWPFLQEVVKNRQIPEERLRLVERHYEAVGGASPYHQQAVRLFERLQTRLSACGVALPLFLGMRCWHPFLKEVLGQVRQGGFRKGFVVILAPHRAQASFDRYVQLLEAAKKEVGASYLQYECAPAWHQHPLFLEAQADRVRPLLDGMDREERNQTHVMFTAHSIPVAMARSSRYEEAFQASSAGVARLLGVADWSLAYQSRSGDPSEAWLGPDVVTAVTCLKAQNKRGVVAVPVGFLFDHVEVLYDLDVEARRAAEGAGLTWRRAQTVMDHPRFVEMLAQLIREGVK